MKLKIKRGQESDMPVLEEGELALATDTKKVFVGTSSGNSPVLPAAEVATTSKDGFMSAADKTKLNSVATNANNYVHPTTAGNKHIPSGGGGGQFLGWGGNGTAKWQSVNASQNIVDGYSVGAVRGKYTKNGYTMGLYALAEGYSTEASGESSHAEGKGTTVSGESSHVEGCYTTVSGNCSHAEGSYTYAVRGDYDHAEGRNTIASGYGCHAEGYGTIAVSFSAIFHIVDVSGETVSVEGVAGYEDSFEGYFNELKTGDKILISGIADYMVEPYISTISSIDYNAHTITISGSIEASDFRSGYIVLMEGHAFAYEVYHPTNHAEGYYTVSIGCNSHTEGLSTIASMLCAHAEGNTTIASGNYAHAEGNWTKASGDSAHAEGSGTKALGNNSHAEGNSTIASGYYSHAEGSQTTARGYYCHVEGIGTDASGYSSHAGGYYTVARAYETAIGHSNIDTGSDTAGYNNTKGNAFIIGNGTGNSAKSNCFRVQYDGRTYAKGAYSSSGADYAELFEWEDGNPDNEDRRGLFVKLDKDKVSIADSPTDNIWGIVSSNPSAIGNNQSEIWKDMYLKDVYGEVLTEDKSFPAEYRTETYTELETDAEGRKIEVEKTREILIHEAYETEVPILNPAYDASKSYIARDKRKEWACVGLLGQIVTKDDGSCEEGKYCQCSKGGIATRADAGHYVMKRLNKNHILVFYGK